MSLSYAYSFDAPQTAGSTATQSTVNTGVGIHPPPDRHLIPPATGHYGSHYVAEQRDNYYPPSTKSYNQTKAQVMPPNRPAYHAPQYALPAEHAAPRMAQAQPQQIAQAPSQSSQGTDSGAPTCDDKDGHYIVTPGSYFGPQHKCKLGTFTMPVPELIEVLPAILVRIIRLLGQGTFGKVVEATERGKSLHKVAVKIIRAVPKYREAAGIEIRVLRTLRDNDPENTQYVEHVLTVEEQALKDLFPTIVNAFIFWILLIGGIIFAWLLRFMGKVYLIS